MKEKSESELVDLDLDQLLQNVMKEEAAIMSGIYYTIQDSSEETSVEEYLRLIELVKIAKQDIFFKILNAYNTFLDIKFDTITELEAQNSEYKDYSQKFLNENTSKIYLLIMLSAIISIKLSIYIAILNLALKTVYSYANKILEELMELINKKISYWQDFQNSFYAYCDNMRADYHKSKKELESLKERAKNGENIMDELLQIAHPSSIRLELVEFSEEEKEAPKQLIKQ